MNAHPAIKPSLQASGYNVPMPDENDKTNWRQTTIREILFVTFWVGYFVTLTIPGNSLFWVLGLPVVMIVICLSENIVSHLRRKRVPPSD